MAKMIDIYGPIGHAELDQFIASGADAFGRYLGRKSMGFSKGMTQEEVALIKGRGKQIVSIYEDKNNYAAYFSFAQGLLDGARALEDAKWLGQPYNTTAVYFPADYDVQAHDIAAIEEYLRGARQALGGLYKIGFYGGYFAVENITGADFYGQTAAWSNGKISTKAHWYQGQIDVKLGGYDVDIDTITGDIGAWPDHYPSIKVTVNGKAYPAIVVNGSTHIAWTAFRDAGEHITKAEYGDVEIGGHKPDQVAYNGDTYLVWSAFTNMDHKEENGGWAFTTKPASVKVTVTAPGKAPLTVQTESAPPSPADVLTANIIKNLPAGMDAAPGTTTHGLITAIAKGITSTPV